MGYKGRGLSDKQGKFSKYLRSLDIAYDEIDHTHPLAIEYPCVQNEAELIPKQLDQKRWICMDQRDFKKAVLRLNTENAEVVRDYYLNLEEAMFAYGEYTMNYLIEKTEWERKMRDGELSQMVKQLAIKDKSEQQALLEIESAKAVEEELKKEQKELRNKLVKSEQQALLEIESAKAVEEELKKEQEELRNKLAKAERKAIRVNKFMKRITIKEKKMEWIYIATNNFYALERLWKVGSTTRLSSRIGGYNTGRAKGVDNYY
jgi:hypothetical protein